MTDHSPPADIASRRAAAVDGFIRTALHHIPDPAIATAAQLQAVAKALEQLGLQRDLFPDEHFPALPDDPSPLYRLAEDADHHYALYVATGASGKQRPPHDHGTWAIVAGISGTERNVLYRRSPGDEPLHDKLVEGARIDVVPGASVHLSSADLHTIELIGDGPFLHLHFYGLALDRQDTRVMYDNPKGGASRSFGPPRSILAPCL